jgi:glutathione S-transferase
MVASRFGEAGDARLESKANLLEPGSTAMELFGSFTSPYVRHCRIVLAETGLECDFVETDYAQSAARSPARRVPFLRDGDLMLTDSTSILRHLREKAGQTFFPELVDFDFFLLVNTALDSSVNLFLLERDGLTPGDSAYLQRQSERVSSTLTHLEQLVSRDAVARRGDGALRLACFLSWGLFRGRLALDDHPSLERLLVEYDHDATFASTHPSLAG